MGMRVEELMAWPPLSSARLVAGSAGIYRVVDSVNMMDAPDIVEWIRPGEFLLTTAFGIKDDLDAQQTFISRLSERGCSGVAIKTKRYFDAIPEPMILQANALELPLFELPYQDSLGEVARQVLSRILGESLAELQYTLQLHQRFFNAVVAGGGSPAVAKTLGEILEVPVIVSNAGREITGVSTDAQADPTYRHLVKALLSHRPPVVPGEGLTGVTVRYQERDVPLEVYPVLVGRRFYGLIVLMRRPARLDARVALEQAASALAIEELKRHAADLRVRRLKSAFVLDLLRGGSRLTEAQVNEGTVYGFEPGSYYACAVGRFDPAGEDRALVQHALIEQIEAAREDEAWSFIAIPHHDDIVVVASRRTGGEGPGGAGDELVAALARLREEMLALSGVSVAFGVGGVCPALSGLPVSLSEAAQACEAAWQGGQRGFVKPYRSQRLEDLLQLVPGEEQVAFVHQVLGELLRLEPWESRTLLDTLASYLDNRGQASEAARRLFVHRNTVLYRIKKVEEILRVDLDDPAETLRVRIALMLERLLGGSGRSLH